MYYFNSTDAKLSKVRLISIGTDVVLASSLATGVATAYVYLCIFLRVLTVWSQKALSHVRYIAASTNTVALTGARHWRRYRFCKPFLRISKPFLRKIRAGTCWWSR